MQARIPLALDKDIWRLAGVLIEKYGEGAIEEAERRATLALKDEDEDGQRIWLAVMTAIMELARSPVTGENDN